MHRVITLPSNLSESVSRRMHQMVFSLLIFQRMRSKRCIGLSSSIRRFEEFVSENASDDHLLSNFSKSSSRRIHQMVFCHRIFWRVCFKVCIRWSSSLRIFRRVRFKACIRWFLFSESFEGFVSENAASDHLHSNFSKSVSRRMRQVVSFLWIFRRVCLKRCINNHLHSIHQMSSLIEFSDEVQSLRMQWMVFFLLIFSLLISRRVRVKVCIRWSSSIERFEGIVSENISDDHLLSNLSKRSSL